MSGNKTKIMGRCKAHTVPNCFVGLLEDLESLKGVYRVRSGPFLRRGGGSPRGLDVKYFCAQTRDLRITARRRDFLQDFHLMIDPRHGRSILKYITNYKL